MEPEFPIHLLMPRNGELYAMLWKNEYRPLALRWTCTVGFHAVPYGDGDEETALCIEDFQPRVRQWRELVGFSCTATEAGDVEDPTGSFYLMDHRPAQKLKLDILKVNDRIFTVHVAMRVDLNDRYDLEDPPHSDVDVIADVPFEDVLVDGRVVPKPTGESAITVLGPFIDPTNFGPPIFDGNFWRFRPKP